MRTRLPALVVAVLLPLVGALIGCGAVSVGSGNVRAETRPVSGFTKIELSGFGTMVVTQTGTESLKIEADDNILPLLTSEVQGDTLVLGVKPGTNITTARISYTVTVKQLTGIQLSGSSEARLDGVTTSSMSVGISGSGQVRMTGSADNQQIDISGSGNYDGSGFPTKTAKVEVSGAGTAVVKVSDALDVSVSGAGTVDYIGNPARVNQDVSGSGSVRQRG